MSESHPTTRTINPGDCLDGDYITIIDAPPILDRWRSRRAQVLRYITSIDHYEVLVDGQRILLSADEIIVTDDDLEATNATTSMRSIKEIEAKIQEIASVPPLVTHGPVWKSAVLTALLWVLREKSASALFDEPDKCSSD